MRIYLDNLKLYQKLFICICMEYDEWMKGLNRIFYKKKNSLIFQKFQTFPSFKLNKHKNEFNKNYFISIIQKLLHYLY